jgi:hypothetical protein
MHQTTSNVCKPAECLLNQKILSGQSCHPEVFKWLSGHEESPRSNGISTTRELSKRNGRVGNRREENEKLKCALLNPLRDLTADSERRPEITTNPKQVFTNVSIMFTMKR